MKGSFHDFDEGRTTLEVDHVGKGSLLKNTIIEAKTPGY